MNTEEMNQYELENEHQEAIKAFSSEEQEMPRSSFDRAALENRGAVVKKRSKKRNKYLAQMLMVSVLSATVGASASYFLAEYRFKTQQKPLFHTDLNEQGHSVVQTNTRQEITLGVNKVLSPKEIAKIASPAVVAINTEKEIQSFFGKTKASSAGSGVLIHAEGYVATNYHVIEGANRVELTLNNGKKYSAKLVGGDETTDLALLKIESDEHNFPYLELADSSQVEVGEQVVAIGNPLGQLEGSLTVGYISAVERNIEIDGESGRRTLLQGLLQTDAAINRGNSGGALINQEGKLLGINTLKTLAVGVEGIGFAIPSNTVKPILEELKTYGKIKSRPIFGISGQNIGQDIANRYDLPQGVWIKSVLENGPADGAGLKAQDIIVAINEEEIHSVEQMQNIRLKHKIGDVLKVKYIRQGETYETELILGEDPHLS